MSALTERRQPLHKANLFGLIPNPFTESLASTGEEKLCMSITIFSSFVITFTEMTILTFAILKFFITATTISYITLRHFTNITIITFTNFVSNKVMYRKNTLKVKRESKLKLESH